MIEILLLALSTLVIINISLQLRNKSFNGQSTKLNEIENALIKFDSTLEKNEKSIKDEFQRNRLESNQTAKENRDELSKNLKEFSENYTNNNKDLNELIRQKFGDFQKQQNELNKSSVENIKDVKLTIEKELKQIRLDNTNQLTEMRKTVDEKLQTTLEKRLGESFKLVSERLEQVHKGLGEMQNIATGVGDLKKVLSNVKTRGVLGEYQLENILEQLLTKEQYSKNVATKKGSHAYVEFAIKLPGRKNDTDVWMPIDSKFPIENYQFLLDTYEDGKKDEIVRAQKTLHKSIESFAKEISEKYLDPPHTTDFGIMFLPVESLYAEVLRDPGLFETLQRKYRITVTGPTTLSALLNSLQMGFRTLAVQKRSSEVWKILEAVKTEFNNFSEHLEKVDKQLTTASKSLYELRNTRTNVMTKKLENVSTIEKNEASKVLELTKSKRDNELDLNKEKNNF